MFFDDFDVKIYSVVARDQNIFHERDIEGETKRERETRKQ